MAFDVAAIQALYGTRAYDPTNFYVLYSTAAPEPCSKHFYCIWDTGTAPDTITAAGSPHMATIDLRAASLLASDPNAGGYVSYLHDPVTLHVAGGFTIANGVVIENAVGGNADDRITGNPVANTLEGGDGNDELDGREGNDALYGGPGNDRLNGGAGNDLMAGGLGNDIYVVDSATDRVFEAPDEGADTIATARGSLSLAATHPLNTLLPLYPQVDNVTYIGSGNFVALGNALGNVLTGGAGNDTLNGMAGSDTLIGGDGNDVLAGGLGDDVLQGGAGNDAFLFHTALAANIDTIDDFVSGADKLRFDNAVFTAIGTNGALAASAFAAGNFSSGQDPSDRLIYDTSSGTLYYDRDGSGAAAAVHIATLTDQPTLQASDIVVV
jgi:Ca2+-binding RTX toxin-like protein